MALTRQEIQINFEKTIQQAKELENLANQIDRLCTGRVDDAMGHITATWKGETAEDYHKKCSRLSGNIKGHSSELRKTANVLRNAAENTYRAELLVLELAEKRWRS